MLRREIMLTHAKLKQLSYYTVIGDVQLHELKKKLRQVGSLTLDFGDRAGVMSSLQADIMASAGTLGLSGKCP